MTDGSSDGAAAQTGDDETPRGAVDGETAPERRSGRPETAGEATGDSEHSEDAESAADGAVGTQGRRSSAEAGESEDAQDSKDTAGTGDSDLEGAGKSGDAEDGRDSASARDADAEEDGSAEGNDSADVAGDGETGGDARLRAAVAAWVRTGEAKDASETAEPESAATDENDDSPEPEPADKPKAPNAAKDPRSTAGAPDPVVEDARPANGDPRSGAEAKRPAAKTPGATEEDPESGFEDARPATEDPRSGVEDARPAAKIPGSTEEDPESVVEDARPAAEDPRSGAEAKRPAGETLSLTGTDPESGVEDARPASEDARPAGDDARSSAEDARPAAKDASSGAGKSRVEDARPGGEGAEDDIEDARPAIDDARPGGNDGEAEPEDDQPEVEDKVPGDSEAAGGGAPVRGPAVADGGKGPQGPPAGDDESRTGGAGGKTANADANADANAAAPAKPVDQPTAVFKRPKPQVDQPTTMLKLGGKLGDPKTDPKTDPERTSKFVALKPLDEPATKKPADATAPVPQVGPERTTQQPLPPKPPLDLLAELTNTPPPPQTPVRTILRRIKIWTPLVLLLALVFAIVQAVRPLPTPTLALTADDSYTFDGSPVTLPWPNEGQGRMDVNGIGTMGAFGKQTPVAIGSVAKAMTAYIVLKDHPLKAGQDGPKITVDALAEKEAGYWKDGESTLTTVKKGDVLTEQQALSAIMIPSANNIARLLARWDAGSEAAFIKKMNDTAQRLGMTNTTYTDASGLKETTVSTASDQVKLGNQLVKIPALMAITKLPSWVDPSGKKWDNYNRLVPYNGAIGIKTGTTTKAGGNLLFAATKEVDGETVTVVGAILGQHTSPIIDTVNAVSKTAMLAAQDALKSAKILKKGDVVGYVDDKLGGRTPVVATKDVAAVGWSGFRVKLSFDADDVPHSAKAGTTVGTLTVGDGTSGAVKVPVALQKDLSEPGLTAKLTRLG
ncbi:D-alanyl-D-alanine carboxypeptidase [Streptomyces sp. NPDC002144]